MKRVIVKAFTAHSLTLTVDATKFLVEELDKRLASSEGGVRGSKVSQSDAQEFLNQLLASADKSKRT